MTWLKHEWQLINLAHIPAIQVTKTEVEFSDEWHESAYFNSVEAAQAYFDLLAQILGVKE